MAPRSVRRFGTHRDHVDHRDHVYAAPPSLRRRLPHAVDLRPSCPPVYDQKHLNSCSANAIAAAVWFDGRRLGIFRTSPSRLFLYFNERKAEGLVSVNGTVSLRDGYRSMAREGICSERMWPYDVRRYRREPPPRCYDAARAHRAIWYGRVPRTLADMKGCLAEGFPFTAGLAVHRSFLGRETRRTGMVSRPVRGDARLGGHAMLVVGYRDGDERFIVRNSFGARWGDRGHCYVPYEYMLDAELSWDLWTVRRLHK